MPNVIRFPDPDFLTKCEISTIWRRFPLIFLFPNILTWKVYHLHGPPLIITTKFEVDMITHCQVKVFCLVISYVTLWSWPLTFWPCTAVTHAGRVTTLPPSLKTIRLCVLELSVITSFIGYHWHCVFGFCACAVSRDLSVGVNFTHIFGIHNPDLSIHYATLLALWWR